MGRKGRKRLSVDVPVGIHREIAALAGKRNITITTWVLRSLIESIAEEIKYREVPPVQRASSIQVDEEKQESVTSFITRKSYAVND